MRNWLQPWWRGVNRRSLRQSGFDWILMDVPAVMVVILIVVDAMVGRALLPDQERVSEFSFGPKREASFDILESLFKRNVLGGREDEMEVIGHDDELVQEKATFPAIVLKDVDQESSHLFGLKIWAASVGDRRDKERADFL